MNRNEPSGTHVMNAGGGEEGTDAGLGRVCQLEIGSETSWDLGPAILFACSTARLISATRNKNVLTYRHSSRLWSIWMR